ncbi:MAG: HDOD domain-containing protein [Deltaproteobacteria bacterium]|nr:HDOD domain-containing protein [Deltaproteobacteria bacterium]
MSQTELILAAVDKLPTLPGVVARMCALVSSDVWSAEDFEEVVGPDPALTANLLRFANSPYFGLRRKITTVQQAVMLMGIKRVFEIAAMGAFSRIIPPYLSGYETKAADFWVHCVAVAMLSERLVVELGVKMPELIFTAGLLHDIGKLVIGVFLSNQSKQIVVEGDSSVGHFLDAERAALGTDHTELGGALAKKWNLPEVVEYTALWHHRPSEAPDEGHRVVVDLVHTANALAHSLGYGVDRGELSRQVDPAVLQRLHVQAHRLERVAGETFAQIQSMGEFITKDLPKG